MSAPACNPFHKGDRVRLTARAEAMFPTLKGLPGVVANEPKRPHMVGVRFRLHTQSTYLSVGFLERIEPCDAPAQQATDTAPPKEAEIQ